MSSTEFTGVTTIFDLKPSGGTVDLKFKDIPITQVTEYVAWQGTTIGLKALADALVSALITGGVFTAEQIIAAQEGL